jgi:hypothetical protein
VSYAVRLVNKDADDRLVFRPGDLGVHEFQSVVDCDAFSDCLHTLFNRTRAHGPSEVCSEKLLAQKKKWARTHRTIPPRFEQVVNYTETSE